MNGRYDTIVWSLSEEEVQESKKSKKRGNIIFTVGPPPELHPGTEN